MNKRKDYYPDVDDDYEGEYADLVRFARKETIEENRKMEKIRNMKNAENAERTKAKSNKRTKPNHKTKLRRNAYD